MASGVTGTGVPAQAPEGADVGGKGAGQVGRSWGGCPTAGDTPLPLPHNGENRILDLLCHSPFSDLLARRRWCLAVPPRDSLPGQAPGDACGVGGSGVHK